MWVGRRGDRPPVPGPASEPAFTTANIPVQGIDNELSTVACNPGSKTIKWFPALLCPGNVQIGKWKTIFLRQQVPLGRHEYQYKATNTSATTIAWLFISSEYDNALNVVTLNTQKQCGSPIYCIWLRFLYTPVWQTWWLKAAAVFTSDPSPSDPPPLSTSKQDNYKVVLCQEILS